MNDDPTGTPPQEDDSQIKALLGSPATETDNREVQEDNASIPTEEDRVYLAALRATMALVPITAVFVTAAAYVASGGAGFLAVAIGTLVAIFAWLLAAVCARRCVTPNSADPRNYHLIREKLDRLKNRTKCLCEEPENNLIHTNGKNGTNNTAINGATREIVCKQVLQECKEIERGLKSAGMPWATRLGYIELWRRIHRAEEALIKVQPKTEVLAGAMRDELRLVDSNMTNKETLLKRLRSAVAILDSMAACKNLVYVEKPEEEARDQFLSKDKRQKQEIREKAITILSEIRYEINYFRDKGAEGIIQARNRLGGTSVVLGSTTYVLLALTILAGAPPATILAASAYFLVGALTGLFARSQAEWTSDTAVGDFGLSASRLFHVPWLSGLAAVAGVLVMSVIDNQFISQNPSNPITDIAELFHHKPSLFVVAAVFGLTPDLLIRRLTQQADVYKGDLQSTETSQSTKSTQKAQTEVSA